MLVINGPPTSAGPTIAASTDHVSSAPGTDSAREAPSDVTLSRPILALDAANKTANASSQYEKSFEHEQNQFSRIDLFQGFEAQAIFEAIAQPERFAVQPEIQDVASRYVEAIASQVHPKETMYDPAKASDTSKPNLTDQTNPFERSNIAPNPIDLRF